MYEQQRLKIGKLSHKGMGREINEDSFAVPEGLDPMLIAKKGLLYIVADGMGGHKAGKTASLMATRTVMSKYYSDPSPDVAQSLERAIQTANAEIYNKAQSPGYEGMGTTLVAAVVKGNWLFVANVGDSRAYLIRGRKIKQITQDHSQVAEQVRAGLLTAEEARHHKFRNIITRSVGTKPKVEVDLFREKIRPGDTVLLCSDGLTNEVRDEEILQIVISNDPQGAAKQLIELANQRGGSDDITVLVLSLIPPPQLAFADLLRSSRFAPVVGGVAIAIVFLIALYWALMLWGTTMSPKTPSLSPSTTAIISTPTSVPSAPASAEPQTFDTEVQKGPVRYVIKRGDYLFKIAQIFGVEGSLEQEKWAREIATKHPEILLYPGDINKITYGSSIITEPFNFGYMIGGKVANFLEQDFTAGFELVLSTSKKYRIVFRDPESVRRQPSPLIDGEVVRVFGYPKGEDTLEAALVDRYLEKEGRWQNWCFAPAEEGKRVWVYGKLNKWGFGGVEGVEGLTASNSGKMIAAYGFWERSYLNRDIIAFRVIEAYFWSETEGCYVKPPK